MASCGIQESKIAGIDGINIFDGIGKMDKNTYRRTTNFF